MSIDENHILELERRGVVSATFRKLAPSKKAAIYSAILGELGQEVFDRASLDRVALAAGVSKGSLIQYFQSKENILRFAGDIFARQYEQFLADYFGRERAVRVAERLLGFFMTQLEHWEKSPIRFRFYLKVFYENDGALTQIIRRQIQDCRGVYLARIIRRGVETGELRGDLDEGLMNFILAAVLADLEQKAGRTAVPSKSRPNLEATAEGLLRGVLDGLRA